MNRHPLLLSTFPATSPGLRTRNLKLTADGPDGAFLDFAMPGNAGNPSLPWMEPDGVCSAFPVEHAAMLPQMPLQIRQLHASAKSSVSRTAFGDNSCSAISRWHSNTSLSASSKLTFASTSVSPCEIAAGTSSTKQVNPPSAAGSKTAVSFISWRIGQSAPKVKPTAPPRTTDHEQRTASLNPQLKTTLNISCNLTRGAALQWGEGRGDATRRRPDGPKQIQHSQPSLNL